MADQVIRKRQPPPRLGHKRKQIVVGDMVKARYGNTSNYWSTKVLVIHDGHMTVQLDDPQGQDATVTVPHASVRALGADCTYDDDCSALGGASSSKASSSKTPRAAPLPVEVEWDLNEITKVKVTTAAGAYEDAPIVARTMLTFICSIKSRLRRKKLIIVLSSPSRNLVK